MNGEMMQSGGRGSALPWWQVSLGCLSCSCLSNAPFVQCEYLEREPEVIPPRRWDEANASRQSNDGTDAGKSAAWELEDAPKLPGYDDGADSILGSLQPALDEAAAGILKGAEALSHSHSGLAPAQVADEPSVLSKHCEPSAVAGSPKKSTKIENFAQARFDNFAQPAAATLALAAAAEGAQSSRPSSQSSRSTSAPVSARSDARALELVQGSAPAVAPAAAPASVAAIAPASVSAAAPEAAPAAVTAATSGAAPASEAAAAPEASPAAVTAATSGAAPASEAAAADLLDAESAHALASEAAAELAKVVVQDVVGSVSAKLDREAELVSAAEAAMQAIATTAKNIAESDVLPATPVVERGDAKAAPASPSAAAVRAPVTSPGQDKDDAASSSFLAAMGFTATEADAASPPVAARADATTSSGNVASESPVNIGSEDSGDTASLPTPATSAPSKKKQISDRLKAYQAACAPAKQPAQPQTLQSRVRSQSGGVFLRTRTSTLSSQWPTRKLKDIRAQHALKAGIVKLHEELTTKTDVDLTDLPEMGWGDGKPQLLGRAFLRRILSGQVELKASAENDVAAAQMDLKHLRTEQLIAIRSRNLDLATESATHTARTNFLETTDKHLFEKLARQCLLGSSESLPTKQEVLHSLGLHVTLVVGVVEMLNSGWGKAYQADGISCPEASPAPNSWAMRLEAGDWPQGCRAALLKVRELQLQPLLGEHPDFAGPACGEPVAIVRDQSSGTGKDRMLHWEIAAVDPTAADVLEEMEKIESKVNGSQLTNELAEKLAQRGIALSNEEIHSSA